MAKKIRLDFSKVEERSGWNSRQMPEGLHEFKIELVDLKDANDGTAMWTYGLRPTDSKYKSRLFPFYCKIQPNQLWKLRDLFVAAGIPVPKKVVQLDPEAPVGKLIAGDVQDETNAQYGDRSTVQNTYSIDALEDNGSDDVDDDEDIEDEEAEDEEYEDVEEDEEEEDLESLSLAELRKRAKDAGIDTAGLKKADLIAELLSEESDEDDEDEDEDLDDEELDDEELEDEDFEDEEDDEDEEPEPAPRRRAAPAKKAAPVRKAAAKEAPARRTVRRR